MSKTSNELVALIDEALGDGPKSALIAARRLGEEIQWLQGRAVTTALANGYNWGQIGRLLGLTRQGARKKFAFVPATPAPHVLLRDAHLEAESQAEAVLQRFRDAHESRSSSISQQS